MGVDRTRTSRRALTVVWVAVVTAIIIVGGMVFAATALTTHDDSALANGTLVEAAGVTQYVACAGPRSVTPTADPAEAAPEAAAAPTVVLIGGLGASSQDAWSDVMPAVAASSRVCAVDRPGTGESPDRSGDANSPVLNAHEMLAALAAAGEPGPYVFVGWSYGGVVALTAAAETQPQGDLAGVVLVDSSLPDEYRTIDTEGWEEGGVELDMASAEPVIASLRLGGVPVVVLVAGQQPYEEAVVDDILDKADDLSQKSSDFVFAEVPNSGHFIAGEDPAAVIAAIAQVLAATAPDIEMPPCPAEFADAGVTCLDGM